MKRNKIQTQEALALQVHWEDEGDVVMGPVAERWPASSAPAWYELSEDYSLLVTRGRDSSGPLCINADKVTVRGLLLPLLLEQTWQNSTRWKKHTPFSFTVSKKHLWGTIKKIILGVVFSQLYLASRCCKSPPYLRALAWYFHDKELLGRGLIVCVCVCAEGYSKNNIFTTRAHYSNKVSSFEWASNRIEASIYLEGDPCGSG